ncbi:hypothetical protein HKT18_06645 [Flavobacterium sp. IMCC34852]|uniref:Uncharacterized protein n=1 Tax=Flavobacterium rivulicola TaxID=2732161 RepID=A0A7Y3R8K9_9FLAO|nr:hypothetical protein [Flavobacterium sp. IMCC34852]NNT71889.1 hypothetical protein [Flavobacterium sp. IMCC34852]
MKFKFFFLFVLIQSVGFCQSTELTFLRGKIICPIKELGEVNIFNLRSETVTNSNEIGNYSLFVKVGDTLEFKSLQIETQKIVISEADLSKPLLVTTLTPKTIDLSEVEIKDYSHINAVSLRILEKPAKKYTPAERRLRTAESFHWYSPLLIPLGGMSVDGILNAISGRKAMLQKELEIEKKERMMVKIENQFTNDYFIEKLKIPEEHVKGFLYYIVDDTKLITLINEKNKGMAEFRMSELVTTYLDIIKSTDK